jgi:uncharacterized protein (TIGR04255 family)
MGPMPELEDDQKQYAKPPIIEAVIDFQFRADFSDKTLEKMLLLLKSTFPQIEQQVTFDVQIAETKLGVSPPKPSGFKLSSGDQLDIVLLRKQAVTNSRLAPYQGWPALEERTRRVWDRISKFVSYHDVRRVGVRYINRLDIPGQFIKTDEWITMGLKPPSTISRTFGEFGFRVVTHEAQLGTILACGSVPSPLVDHSSINLDIDVFADHDLPEREEEMWAFLRTMRQRKNEVFESCITEKMRQQFG